MSLKFALVAVALVRVAAQPVPIAHSGTVRSAGQAIPGATVMASGADSKLTTTTDEQGQYRFEKMVPGAWKFEIQMPGFRSASREIAVAAGAAPEAWTLELQPRPAVRTQGQGERRGSGFQRLSITARDGAAHDGAAREGENANQPAIEAAPK